MMISVKSLAERWGVCPGWVYDRLNEGRLPELRLSGKRLIPMKAILAMEEEACRSVGAGTGSKSETASGASAGRKLVENEPEAQAQRTTTKPSNGQSALPRNWRNLPNLRGQR